MVKAAAQKTPCPVGKDTKERQMQYNMQLKFSASLWACRSVCVKSKVMVFTDSFPGPYGWLCGPPGVHHCRATWLNPL
jgi:hypothetical protein